VSQRARRTTAADHAHGAIRRRILDGDLPLGAMLSESELATELGTSRTPVRSALVRLQDEGLVQIYPQRGALVRALTDSEVREAAEVRHAFEVAGVRRAPAARRAKACERLTAGLDAQEQALAAGDFTEFADLASAFHRSFVELADNATMLEHYDRMADRQFLSILRARRPITDDPTEVLTEHRDLLDDVRVGDWVRFADRLEDHQSRHHRLDSRPTQPASP
jgi:DNA-binding GntR family transcriptional regulator